MRYGYIRDARNNEENLQKQKEALHKFNLDSIIREPLGYALGEGFLTLLDKLQPWDELYIDHVSRITRDQSKFLDIINLLSYKKVILYESGNRVDFDSMKLWLLFHDNFSVDEDK